MSKKIWLDSDQTAEPKVLLSVKWNPASCQPVPQTSVLVLFITFIDNFTHGRGSTHSAIENGTTLGCPERESCYSEELNNLQELTDWTPIPRFGAALLHKPWCPSEGQRIWGPCSWLWSGLSSLRCRQSVWENDCSCLISTYHIWTEHIILDSSMPQRCGCVQQNTAERHWNVWD